MKTLIKGPEVLVLLFSWGPGLTEPWLEHYRFGHAYGFHISQREGKVSRPRVKAAISPLYLRHSPKQSLNELLELMS